jgi:hypothetical protein
VYGDVDVKKREAFFGDRMGQFDSRMEFIEGIYEAFDIIL